MNIEKSRPHRAPWVTLTIAAVACAIESSPRLQSLCQLSPTTTSLRQAYRLFTCHLTHWSADHLIWDVAAFVVLGALCERTSRVAFVACLFASAAAISLAIQALEPGFMVYRGLSGIDSALIGWLTLCSMRRERSRSAVVAGVLLTAFFAKCGFELVTGRAIFVDARAGGFVPAPLAHLVGAGFGALFALGHAVDERRRSRVTAARWGQAGTGVYDGPDLCRKSPALRN